MVEFEKEENVEEKVGVHGGAEVVLEVVKESGGEFDLEATEAGDGLILRMEFVDVLV